MNGTNPRALADQAHAEQRRCSAVAVDEQDRAAWERVRELLRAAVDESTWEIWLEPLELAGRDGRALQVAAAPGKAAWVRSSFSRLLDACATSAGVELQVVEARRELVA